MKKVILLLFILLLQTHSILLGQSKNAVFSAVPSASHNAITEQNTGFTETVTIAVTTGASTSGNSRAPQGSQRYIRTCYIISAAEMQAAGFPVGEINLIGFTYSTAQSVTTTGTFKVYMKNTTDVSYALPSTAWTNGSNGVIDGMTLACDRSITIPNTTGVFDIPFTGGSAFTYTGGGVYIAFEYQNPSPGTVSTSNVAYCNTTITTGLRNAFSTTTLPTALTNASAFRPITRLGANLIDVVEVTQIYALGQIPVPFGNPNIIKALVTNKSDAALTFDVNVNVFKASDGTSRYSNSQTVTDLAAGASQTLTFSDYTSSVIETDSIKVTVAAQPGENWTTNNTRSVVQDVNSNTYSYNQGTVASGGVGFNGATGDFVAKFT
ncbi:MAG: hypothetical protein HYV28_04780, partial [Ignavibacteriales bacterium]|nr:hypothetical protein [Ignavibacteriales bacterium]